MAFGASFTARFTRNVYDYDEVNLVWDDDGYNIIGTSNGELEGIYRLRTADISRRDYYQTDLQFKKNYADRWQLLATYSYVVSRAPCRPRSRARSPTPSSSSTSTATSTPTCGTR